MIGAEINIFATRISPEKSYPFERRAGERKSLPEGGGIRATAPAVTRAGSAGGLVGRQSKSVSGEYLKFLGRRAFDTCGIFVFCSG
jgi:hypothetical protein